MLPDLAISWQLFIWAIASCLLTFLWFKLFKPLMADRTKAGISREAILGESGQVIKVPEQENRGIVRFTTPLLGADEWPFICDQDLAVGDRVTVKDISGNTLIVEKRESNCATTNTKWNRVVIPAERKREMSELQISLGLTSKSSHCVNFAA